MQLFLVTHGDSREGGELHAVIGVFSTHEMALDAAADFDSENGFTEDDVEGALIEEITLDEKL